VHINIDHELRELTRQEFRVTGLNTAADVEAREVLEDMFMDAPTTQLVATRNARRAARLR
jgi:hypothetical protein